MSFPHNFISSQMMKFYVTAAALTLSAASALAQSGLAMAMVGTIDPPSKIYQTEVYTTHSAHVLELESDECVLTIYDADGVKIAKTIVMNGKFTLPAAMIGSVTTLDIAAEAGHQTVEVLVREDADYVDFGAK